MRFIGIAAFQRTEALENAIQPVNKATNLI